MNRIITILVATVAAAVLFACTPDIGPFFKPDKYPEDEAVFARGQLGLITPALNKADELLAFRYLSGLTIDEATASNLARQPTVQTNDADVLGPQAWIHARQQISELPFAYVNTYRSSGSPSSYVYYENCLDDAFTTAARTLKDRQQRYPDHPTFIEWVQAQDVVFANCSAPTPTYPEELSSGAPQLAGADRRYQIAAVHFYAQDLETAEHLFQSIAADTGSPWQKISAYMVGRTLLREVSLQKKGTASDEARQQLHRIADDPAAGPLRDSARGLLEHLNAIDHPVETMQALAQQLMTPHTSNSFGGAINEARYILLADSFRPALSQPDTPEPFDWVKTLESRDESHATDRWRKTHSLPWLTAALIYANGKDPDASELIQEGNRLPTASPAYVTASYNIVRLRMERGERTEARGQLDKLLAHSANQPPSALNAWRAERMQVATSFDDFLLWAPRTPVNGKPQTGDPTADSPVLAQDSAYVLNYLAPVTKLAEAAHSKRLPSWSAADVALAAWTRAFMLQNRDVMSSVAPTVLKAHPNWGAELSPSSTAENGSWRFRAALLIANHAEFDPLIQLNYRKHVDWWGPHWWCEILPPDANAPSAETVAWRLPASFEPSDAVIAKAERSAASDELSQLQKIGSAQSLVGSIILAWAKSHPEDPLVPQALHRVVMVVRYGCHVDPRSGELSKTAFDLLHNRYPKSEWTAKTPFWFK